MIGTIGGGGGGGEGGGLRKLGKKTARHMAPNSRNMKAFVSVVGAGTG